jgi:hypothetical protein
MAKKGTKKRSASTKETKKPSAAQKENMKPSAEIRMISGCEDAQTSAVSSRIEKLSTS